MKQKLIVTSFVISLSLSGQTGSTPPRIPVRTVVENPDHYKRLSLDHNVFGLFNDWVIRQIDIKYAFDSVVPVGFQLISPPSYSPNNISYTAHVTFSFKDDSLLNERKIYDNFSDIAFVIDSLEKSSLISMFLRNTDVKSAQIFYWDCFQYESEAGDTIQYHRSGYWFREFVLRTPEVANKVDLFLRKFPLDEQIAEFREAVGIYFSRLVGNYLFISSDSESNDCGNCFVSMYPPWGVWSFKLSNRFTWLSFPHVGRARSALSELISNTDSIGCEICRDGDSCYTSMAYQPNELPRRVYTSLRCGSGKLEVGSVWFGPYNVVDSVVVGDRHPHDLVRLK